jgi:methionine synthase II (cobalamin-independent)
VPDTSDEARDLMFGKSKSPESLPPTSDGLKLHIERAHFQASVWKQANVVKPVLPSPVTMGAHVYSDDFYRGLCMAIGLFYSCIVTLYNQWSTDTISFQDMLVGPDQVS